MIELNKIYNEDCLEGMKGFPDGSVDCIVTSPPYDNLRKYGGEESFSFDKFKDIAQQLFRILTEGGVCVWIVGDATTNGSETGTSFRQVLHFMKCGFLLHDTMIYQKRNPIPQNHNRYEQCFEYMFVLSKGRPKTFNPIKVETLNKGKIMNWGGRKTKLDSNQCRRHRDSFLIKTKDSKIHSNIFCYTIGRGNTGHPAVFPLQLAIDHILSWSNEGDTVLDPFMGSGNTAIAAIREKRNFIGFELNKEYYDKACKRIKLEHAQLTLF